MNSKAVARLMVLANIISNNMKRHSGRYVYDSVGFCQVLGTRRGILGLSTLGTSKRFTEFRVSLYHARDYLLLSLIAFFPLVVGVAANSYAWNRTLADILGALVGFGFFFVVCLNLLALFLGAEVQD